MGRCVPWVSQVLDAPSLQDDFYLNLVDWSPTNILAVGLGACVYLWSAVTSKVTKMCDLAPDDSICSVAWTQRGTYLAVGTDLGEVSCDPSPSIPPPQHPLSPRILHCSHLVWARSCVFENVKINVHLLVNESESYRLSNAPCPRLSSNLKTWRRREATSRFPESARA